MRKTRAIGLAAALATAMLAASAASAGTFYFGFGGNHGWGHHGWDDDADVYVDVPVYVGPDYDEEDDDRHVAWCENQYDSYDEDTDTYYYAPGKQRRCNSPYD
jgi:hypothetical protein